MVSNFNYSYSEAILYRSKRQGLCRAYFENVMLPEDIPLCGALFVCKVLFIKLMENIFIQIGHPLIQGPGIKWFKENSSFEITCSYTKKPISADLLKFYDGSGKELSKDRGFVRVVLSSSKTFVNVSLTKSSIQADDIGRYYCRYTDNLDIYVHIAVVQGNYCVFIMWVDRCATFRICTFKNKYSTMKRNLFVTLLDDITCKEHV